MITIEDQPYELAPVGQKLIVVASSTNVGNTGFRYKVEVIGSSNDSVTYTSSFYVPPNPADKLIVDLAPIVQGWVVNTINTAANTVIPTNNDYLAGGYDSAAIFYGNPRIEVKIYEAWQVDGVLTDNVSSEVAIDQRLFNGKFQISDGYKPSTETNFGLTSTTSRALSDRLYNTHFFDLSLGLGLGEISTDRTFIPVREADYGTIAAYFEGTDAPISNFTSALKVRISILPASGSPIDWTSDAIGEGFIFNIPCYPANLNANIFGAPKPSDYPNWKAIFVRFLGAADAVKSMTYVLYNADVYANCNCKYDNVRLCWVNSRGAFDYFNFCQKNEQSIEVERRRYRKVVGSYASDTFTFNAYDRGLTENRPNVKKFLNIESGWLQEGEFEFLQSLIQSQSVYIINDNATITPVVIEDTSFTVKKARDKKQYNQALKLRYSQDVNV